MENTHEMKVRAVDQLEVQPRLMMAYSPRVTGGGSTDVHFSADSTSLVIIADSLQKTAH